MAAAGTAEANPASSRVKVGGTASCERFEDTTVTQVSITPKGRSAKTADLSGEDVTETYSVTFTNIPKGKGLTANATVNCEDSDGQAHTYSKSFSITRPAGTTENQTLNLK
ncbi:MULTISPECIES: hypothetical protein [Streptomyces]|uniref:hypothetical protein n=1 Tax=Streptomyces TaxID=1883 RepID=UPI0016731AD4|nr:MULTISPECIES: hypothetical protein [Streptomyces]